MTPRCQFCGDGGPCGLFDITDPDGATAVRVCEACRERLRRQIQDAPDGVCVLCWGDDVGEYRLTPEAGRDDGRPVCGRCRRRAIATRPPYREVELFPRPGDTCGACRRRRDQLPDGERLDIEVFDPANREGTRFLCERCASRGRGMK